MPKISELPLVANPTGTDVVPLVDAGVTKRATLASFPISTLAAAAHAALQGNIDANTTALGLRVAKTSDTGAARLPVGTTGQRDGVPAAGMIRYNATLNQFEGYGSSWGSIGGGATGAPGNSVFVENDQTVTGDYTLTANKNAMSAGPITINTGVTVTVPTGATWSIV